MHISYKYILYNPVIIIRSNVNSNSSGRRYFFRESQCEMHLAEDGVKKCTYTETIK